MNIIAIVEKVHLDVLFPPRLLDLIIHFISINEESTTIDISQFSIRKSAEKQLRYEDA